MQLGVVPTVHTGSRVAGLLPGMYGQVQVPPRHVCPAVAAQFTPTKLGSEGVLSPGVHKPLAPQYPVFVCGSRQSVPGDPTHAISLWGGVVGTVGQAQEPAPLHVDPPTVAAQFTPW